MSELKKESGMCSDFCAKWSDDECRLYLNKLKERKIAYCEEHGIPVPLFDKVEDFFLTREMLFSVEPRKMQRANENDWISVKDRLPGPREDVLFIVEPNGVPFIRIGSYDDGVWRLLCGMWSDYRPFTGNTAWPVTHWMPLPPPPEEAVP